MLKIFLLKKEERVLATVAFLLIASLQALLISHYFDQLTVMGVNYHQLAKDVFHVSGFDAWSYAVVSDWNGWAYNIYRHPLLALFMFIPFLINQGLMAVTGINCALFVVGALETFCAFYAVVFLYRVLRDLLPQHPIDATLLTAFFFSFGYMMLTVIVPDHFCPTLCLMMLTLFIAQRKMIRGKVMTIGQTILLFVFAAGISLNNGIKIFLAAWATNGRKLFRLRFLLMAILLPSALMWGIAVWEYDAWAAPRERIAHRNLQLQQQHLRDSLFRYCADSLQTKDTAEIKRCAHRLLQRMAVAKYRRNHANPKIGDPMSKKGFMVWTDASTNRWRSIVENLFGESIQLHRACLLQDILKDNRPMIVPYELDYYYWIEALIALLFLLGIWCARHSRFFALVAAWFAFDMLIHVVLGFGINEVYIMTAQWAFVIPSAIAFLLQKMPQKPRWALRGILAALTIYLAYYNGSLIIGYLSRTAIS